MLLDVDYYLIAIPAIALSLWARWRIFSACRMAGRVQSLSGLTGAEVARRVMETGAMGTVEIERASGQLANHYDPSRKVLRLSGGAVLGPIAGRAGNCRS